MTARPRAPRRRPLLAAATAALALSACRHENAPAPRPPPRDAIDVSIAALATGEGGAPAAFEVVLRSGPTAPVEVEVRSEDASEGLVLAPGYAAPTPVQGITFTPEDWDVPRQVAIDPVDDHAADGAVRYDVTLRVSYTEDAAYAAVPGVTVAVTNADDDVARVAVSVSELSTRERGPPVRFEARLASVPPRGVYLEVRSGDASEGLVGVVGRFACAYSTWLHFDEATWDVPVELEVCPADEQSADGEQVYAITLAPTGSSEYDLVLAPAVVTVTNADDDVAALVIQQQSDPLVTAEEGTASTFAVSLQSQPAAPVVVPVTSGNPAEGLLSVGGGARAQRLELTFTEASWNVPRIVTVHPEDDAVLGDDVAYAVTVGPPGGADPVYATLAARSIPVRNLDDDLPLLKIDPAGPFTTGETGGSARFGISVTPPHGTVLVRVTSGDPGEGRLRRGGAPEQESVDVWFGPGDWGPKQIDVVGQRDHALDGDASYLVTVAVVSGEGYVTLAPRAVAVTNVDELAGSLPLAAWDATLGVPACLGPGYGCESGTLLAGRDDDWVDGIAEANAPNTLAASYCGDGAYTYMPRSIEELRVYVPDGSPLDAGKEVRIEAKVRVMSPVYDRLDLYLAADASAPSWTYLGTLQPTVSGGLEVLATSSVLPAGTLQALRGNWRYSAWATSPGSCTSGGADDRDDLVFAVSTVAGP